MKNQILPFLIGIFVAISIASTVPELLTVKPATPKSTVYLSRAKQETVDEYLLKGYIIKIVCKGDEWHEAIVVLEKF